jgi:hypothetical protein
MLWPMATTDYLRRTGSVPVASWRRANSWWTHIYWEFTTIPPLFRASIAASIIILIAKSVNRPRLLPICPSDSKCLASATSVIRRANAAFTTFPIMFNNKIGRQAPGVAFWVIVLFGFGKTITLAILNLREK